ncbi:MULTISPECIES: DEAD/DEAH box helicase [unclassified Mammaliicoccus]|uniref:DEAD/DEAH box helicase n=1 Tax=unclassified Mammaliicoccus TaxID=2803851 RepID=UPI001EFB0F1A|nr:MULTISPECIES: DEAD/DEAH box helicase [unclassified Mammaliicoccus]
MSKHPFEHFQLENELVEAVKDLKFNQPTEVQRRVIPKIKKGSNIIGQSQTGTGKSHAFLLPLFDKIDVDLKEPQVIILAPTRELAKQLYDSASHLAEYKKGIKVNLYIGGTDKSRDIDKSKNTPQVVVGTPNRIDDMAVEKALDLHLAKSVVIDEADLMIDLGFMPKVDSIASRLDKSAQISVFSATIPKALHPFLNKYLDKPEFVEIETESSNKDNIDFYLIPTKGEEKQAKMLKVMDVINPYLAIIFANSRDRANELVAYLSEHGYKVGVIHGGLSPRERTQQMKRVKQLDFEFVVASDLASRGIDIEGVSHVINYDLPKEIDFFTHRVGRTGRGDYKGIAITLYTPDEDDLITQIEKKNYKFNHVDIKNGEFVEIKDRQKRTRRVKKEDNIEQSLKQRIKRNNKNKVKPGYKKKFKKELDELKFKEKKAHSKRTKKQSRKG